MLCEAFPILGHCSAHNRIRQVWRCDGGRKLCHLNLGVSETVLILDELCELLVVEADLVDDIPNPLATLLG